VAAHTPVAHLYCSIAARQAKAPFGRVSERAPHYAALDDDPGSLAVAANIKATVACAAAPGSQIIGHRRVLAPEFQRLAYLQWIKQPRHGDEQPFGCRQVFAVILRFDLHAEAEC
jgi:hypothetical protein